MWRRWFIRAICLTLFLACLSGWILSYQKEFLLGHEGAAWHALFLVDGKLGLVRNRNDHEPPKWSFKIWGPVPTFWNDHRTTTTSQALGFFWDDNRGILLCGIPFWFSTTLAALFLFLAWRKAGPRPTRAFPVTLTPDRPPAASAAHSAPPAPPAQSPPAIPKPWSNRQP